MNLCQQFDGVPSCAELLNIKTSSEGKQLHQYIDVTDQKACRGDNKRIIPLTDKIKARQAGS